MTTDIQISPELMKRITAAFKKAKNPEKYWDYMDEISIDTIIKAWESKSEYPIDEVYDSAEDDSIYEIEIEHIKDVLREFEDDIAAENDTEGMDLKDIAIEIKDQVHDLFFVDINIKKVMPKVNVRLVLHSNHDCINSSWLEGSSGYEGKESYFADSMKALCINPYDMQAVMKEYNCKTHGDWPKIPSRKSRVDLIKFYTEIENRSCGANLLTILGQVDSYDLLTKGKSIKLIVPAGNNVGFYSSMQGGGSVFECPLVAPLVIDLTKKEDGGYYHWSLELDDPSDSYSIKSCYGVSNDFFDGHIEIKPVKKQKIYVTKKSI